MISIVSVGRKHLPWVAEGVAEYQRRLRKPFEVEWTLVPHSSVVDKAVAEESQRILTHCKTDDFVVVLDERGKRLSSPGLSELLIEQLNQSRRVVFIIGGAFGVSEVVLARANVVWSLSELVFPHQLVRLILVEQLYRAQTIAAGGEYHHQ